MREIRDYLFDIKNECEYLIKRSKNMDYQDFINNEDLKKSFVRSLEIIGESAKKIPSDVRKRYPEIKWKSVIGMRNKLIHEYFGVDYLVVWKVVKEKVEDLHKIVMKMVNDFK